jgi:hypothetical protein
MKIGKEVPVVDITKAKTRPVILVVRDSMNKDLELVEFAQ